MPRLVDFFLRRQVSGRCSSSASLVTVRLGRRIATWLQVLAGVYLLVMFTNLSLRFWSTQATAGRARRLRHLGGRRAAPERPDVLAPADADYDRRWRRLIFDTPDVVAIQRTDDSVAHYGAALEAGGTRLRLSKGRSRTWRAEFEIARDGEADLRLTGEMDGYRIEARLRRIELDTFRLRQSPFRWVRPPDPFAG